MYDPGYWFAREQFIVSRREQIADYESRDVFEGLIDAYEYVIFLLKDYEECYDEEEKDKKWKEFLKYKNLYEKALIEIKRLLKGSVNEKYQ